MEYTREFWQKHKHLSGEQLARELGIDGGSARRLIRKAKHEFAEVWKGEPVKVQRGVVVFDLHYPCHNKKLWDNIRRFTRDFNPDIFVLGGDNMDLEVVSHWVGNKRRKVEGTRLKKDYDGFNRDVLDPLNDELDENARKVCILGNHEKWVEDYIDEHPEVEGFFEIERNLNLDDWEVKEYGELAKFGHLYITHGEYTNIHNAYKTAQVFAGRCVAYGHVHTYQAHTLVSPIDTNAPYAAVSMPCACHLNPRYRLNHPNAWVNGFGVFYIHPDNTFNLYPVIAINGSFTAPDGTRYE